MSKDRYFYHSWMVCELSEQKREQVDQGCPNARDTVRSTMIPNERAHQVPVASYIMHSLNRYYSYNVKVEKKIDLHVI